MLTISNFLKIAGIITGFVLVILGSISLANTIVSNQQILALGGPVGIFEVGTQVVTGSLAVIGAGVAAIGMIGAGIGQGYATGKAVEAIGRNPEAEAQIRSTMLIGIALTESGALYALVLGILALFLG